MSQQNESGLKAFTANEALEAFRRVKLDTGSGTAVVYADAGESFIGITQKKTACAESVTVALSHAGRTYKLVASEAMAVGATIYGADDGKVKDTAGAHDAIGTALAAASADASVIECRLDNGTAGAINGAAVMNVADGTANGGIPVVFRKAVTAACATVIATLTRKMRVIDFHILATDGTAGNVDLRNGAACSLGAAVAHGSTDEAIVRAAKLDNAKHELASGCTLVLWQDCASGTIVYVTAIPVA